MTTKTVILDSDGKTILYDSENPSPSELKRIENLQKTVDELREIYGMKYLKYLLL